MSNLNQFIKYLDPTLLTIATNDFTDIHDELDIEFKAPDQIFENHNRIGGEYVYSGPTVHDIDSPRVFVQVRGPKIFVDDEYTVTAKLLEEAKSEIEGRAKRIIVLYFWENDPVFKTRWNSCAAFLLLKGHERSESITNWAYQPLRVRNHNSSTGRNVIKKLLGMLALKHPDFNDYPWVMEPDVLPF